MVKPPTDPNPAPSTGGVANAQGQAIFTADWNTLINDLYPHALDSLVNHNAQYGTATVNIPAGGVGGALSVTFPSSFGGPIPEVLVWVRQSAFLNNIVLPKFALSILNGGVGEYRWEPYPPTDTELFGLSLHRFRLNLASLPSTILIGLSGWITSNNDGLGTVELEYSLDGGSTWSVDVGLGGAPLPATGIFKTSSSAVPSAALVDGLWRVVGLNGQGVAGFGINFSRIQVELTYPSGSNIAGTGRLSVTTTGFSARVNSPFPVIASTNVLVGWLAFVP